jgi:sarcosine oxidase
MQAFDAIVLGAGGMGSAAAYYLTKAGQRVLLLEQFGLNHDRGSSYGSSRVIRYAYDEPAYITLMRAAFPLWFALEDDAGEQLYIKTGGLDIGTPDQPSFQQLQTSMEQADIAYEHLTRAEMGDRFPQFCLDPGMEALYQEETGMLAASKCILAHTRLAQSRGATLLDRTPVIKIVPRTSSVEVQTAMATYQAERLVISAGSWSKQLLLWLGINLPLTIMPCQLAFFQPKLVTDYQLGRFPIFSIHLNNSDGEMPYGIPMHDGVGVKLSTFYGWETVEHPSQVDYTPDPDWIERLRGLIRQYLPGVDGPLASTRRCLYTMTPDKHFVIDRHPEYPHIAIAAGFSGHGFKFTTLVGSILTDLLLEGKTRHDISLFKLSRFQHEP